MSLGFLQTPPEMAALMAGVVPHTGAGVPAPVWGTKETPAKSR